jgi:hypothetical protein
MLYSGLSPLRADLLLPQHPATENDIILASFERRKIIYV